MVKNWNILVRVIRLHFQLLDFDWNFCKGTLNGPVLSVKIYLFWRTTSNLTYFDWLGPLSLFKESENLSERKLTWSQCLFLEKKEWDNWLLHDNFFFVEILRGPKRMQWSKTDKMRIYLKVHFLHSFQLKEEPVTNQILYGSAFFKNPLPEKLRNCVFLIEGPGLIKGLKYKIDE